MDQTCASWKTTVLVHLVAVAISGCGAESLEPSDKGEQGVVGTTSQAITYGGHDYLFVTTPKSWQQAQAICSANGYKLVTINDSNEEAFLAAQESAFNLNNWWIGLNDIGIEGFYVWDGDSSTYTNWYPGEPNNSQGNEDCVEDRFADPTQGKYSQQWNDFPCTQQNPFICERDPAPTSNKGSYSYSASNTSNATTGTSDYTVYLYAGQLFTVGTCGIPGASGTGDTYLRVNNPSGQQIAADDDAGGACGVLSNISIVIPTAGSYVIRAGCYASNSCSGTVAFNY